MNQFLKHKGLFCIALMLAGQALTQPVVSRIEYYFDKDPGYGKATAISFTKSTNVANATLNLNPSTISSGVHILYIRAKDTSGVWSHDNQWIFVKPFESDTTKPGTIPNLARVEYYLDKDPGYGKARPISFTPGNNLANIALNLHPDSILNGVHVLYIRGMDTKGAWSLDNSWIFVKPFTADTTKPGAIPNLVLVEYYLDKDPGYGKGRPVSITPGATLSNIALNLHPDSLLNGTHVLYIRAKDAKGAWSLDNAWLFVKPFPSDITPPQPVPNLLAVEYYIDKDPGLGKGIPVAIDDVNNLANINLWVNISKLTAGSHTLYIRAKDKNGAWSHDNRFVFSVASSISTSSIVVNSIANKSVCANDTLKIAYQATGAYNSGNKFNAELSNATGSFTSPITIGSFTGTTNAIITCIIPANTPTGNRYRVRVSSTNPVLTGLPSTDSITVSSLPAIPPAITGPTTVTAGSTTTYTVPKVTGVTHTWTVPTGDTLVSGQGKDTIKVKWHTSGTISVTANNGCGASAKRTLAVTVSGTAPVMVTTLQVKPEEHVGNMVQLMPNPSNGQTSLLFTTSKEVKYEVEVTDGEGRVLLHKDGITIKGINKLELNISSFAAGTYLVNIYDREYARRTIKWSKF